MGDYVGCLVYIGIFAVPALVAALYRWVNGIVTKVHGYDAAVREAQALRSREAQVRSAEKELEDARARWTASRAAQEAELARKESEWQRKMQADREALQLLADEKSRGFPWLAQAYADYFHLEAMRQADLMQRKRHPAPRSAERLRETARQRRNVEKKLRIAQGIIKYYQDMFPFLEDFLGDVPHEVLQSVLARQVEEPIEELIRDVADVGIDAVHLYLSEDEYERLSTAEKNQLALDRYWQRRRERRSTWEIGRDYERYIGYIYERDGYAVSYQGILEGFDDLGRDLICKKGQQTQVVQCKCWSQHWQIHEKHVNQLYGTTVQYRIDHRGEQVFPVLFTSTTLSDRARDFAADLGVIVSEEVAWAEYPSVKCNVSRRTGELIYHLPFDQMYDRTVIEDERNERYVRTATEAEELGFRRAWRWRGQDTE